jgi:hypothetical protein
MTERQAIDLLMQHKSEPLAATAWEGYMAAGRGFLMTDGQSVSYIPLSLVGRFQQQIRRRLLLLVKSYRPATQVVVLLAVPVDREIMLALGKRAPVFTPEAAFLKHAGTPGCPPMQIVFHAPLERPVA